MKWVKAQKYSEKPPEPDQWSLNLCFSLHYWWCWRALPAEINTFWNRYAVQTTTPSWFGTSENGW